jgi:DNA-directed RNA polymerase subunit omega
MARITVEDCIDKFPSRFELVLVASQRARKLHSGDAPTIEKDNDKNSVIALREIAESTISVDDFKENLIQEYQTITITDEEEQNIELSSFESDEKKENTINPEDLIESSALDIKENSSDISEDKNNEIEQEINSLISSEDSAIKEQYDIKENIEDEAILSNTDESNTPPNNDKDMMPSSEDKEINQE